MIQLINPKILESYSDLGYIRFDLNDDSLINDIPDVGYYA